MVVGLLQPVNEELYDDAQDPRPPSRVVLVGALQAPARGLGADRAHAGGAGGQDEGGRDGVARGEEEDGGAVANIQDTSPEVEVHL